MPSATRLAQSLGARRRRGDGARAREWFRGVQSWERSGESIRDAGARAHAGRDGGADGGHEWGRSVYAGWRGARAGAREGGVRIWAEVARGDGRGFASSSAATGDVRGDGGVNREDASARSQGDASSSASASASTSARGETDTRAEADASDRAVLRERILRAALKRVDEHGFSDAAVDAGLRDLKLSPASRANALGRDGSSGAATACGPGALAGELVGYFEEACDAAFHAKVVENADMLSTLNSSDRIEWLVKTRLEYVVPRLDAWPRALATMASPQNALATFKRRASLADDIAQAADIAHVDILPAELDGARWYAERATIVALYAAVELHLATDTSKDFRKTWAFLHARVRDLATARTSALELRSYVDVLARAAGLDPARSDVASAMAASALRAASRAPFAARILAPWIAGARSKP